MPIDTGNQTVHIKYFDPLINTAGNFIALDVRKPGIYSGGYLTRVSDISVSLSTLACEIADSGVTGNQVRITTGAAVSITVAVATPLVVLRWTYTGSATADYMDFVAVADGNQLPTDVVVGLCTFSGSTLTGFDYTDRTNPNVMDLFLKVEPTSPASMYLRVRSGRVNYGSANYDIVDQSTSVFSAPGSGSRIDLVQVSTSGVVTLTTGVASATPSAPSYGNLVTLAEITIASGATTLTASNIKDVRNYVGNSFSNAVLTSGNQTIADVKTFTSFPVGPSTIPTTDYQLTNKKDVDAKTAMGTWAARSANTVYTETTGGFVVGSITKSDNSNAFVTMQTPSGTIRQKIGAYPYGSYNYLPISCPVKKSNTWQLVTSGVITVDYLYFLPLGT